MPAASNGQGNVLVNNAGVGTWGLQEAFSIVNRGNFRGSEPLSRR